MRSFKSNENIHKKEGGSYYVVLANKASSVTLQSSGNKSQKKYTARRYEIPVLHAVFTGLFVKHTYQLQTVSPARGSRLIVVYIKERR